MKRYLLISSLTFIILALINCEKDSTEPNNSSDSFTSVTGDIEESYNATAFFAVSTYTSGDIVKEYFTIMIQPKSLGANPLAMVLLYKLGPDIPLTGTYVIGEYGFGLDIPENEFGGSYSGRNVTDYSSYSMSSGNLRITKATQSEITGEIEMSGYYVRLLEQDTTRIVNVTGNFHATPSPY